MTYRELPAGVTALEEEILARWEAEGTFQESLERRKASPEFVFYEGPPTANGRPGVHHILARTIKDAVGRYRSMTGWHVTRKAGWDTHGLPVEIEAERELGISGKPEIERLGIEEFNRVCRESVFTYQSEWERLSRRIGYWLELADPYITCSTEYIESVWWALQEIDRRGLLYRGYKSLPYCPRCGTGLSSHEVALGYAEVSDPSLYVRFPIRGEEARYLMVWTTTPWTLVSNVAVAFGPHLRYVEIEEDERRTIMSASRAAALLGEEARVVREVPTEEMASLRYVRPLDLVPDYPEETGPVLPAGFVSDEDGTGLVHIAPGFGADDFDLGRRHDLPVVRPVDDAGRFEPDVSEVGGMFVKDADPLLIERLRAGGLVFRAGEHRHSYPHCWRCDSPLLYMARDSWYVRTTEVREKLLEHNARVDWHPPEIGSGRMGEWLANNVDWSISRDRYWGTPLPFWVCDADESHREVLGSVAEIRERAGDLPPGFDPHRPFIDEITWTCATKGCGGVMRRVPEVLDAWFDSGAMPFAQWHYPFENEERFGSHFPAHFIAEGVDQTRGWFYSLLALSTILFDRSAYRAVVVNDLIMDEVGQKMSKSRGNVVDPWEAISEHGADAIRFYLLSASHPWIPKRWNPEGLRETNRKLFDTLRHTYHFFAMYARLEGWRHERDGAVPVAEREPIDRWLLGRLDSVTEGVRGDLEAYDVTRACRRLSGFVLHDMSNWYVRRTRDRFWATRPGASAALGTQEAFATLYEALRTCSLLLAPIAPFLADWLHRELAGVSAHLADFPRGQGREDPELDRGMADVRRLVTLGRAAREQAGVRVRQPLRSLKAVVPAGRRLPDALIPILMHELNVKRVVFASESDEIVRLSVKPDYARLGPRFGGRTRAVARAVGQLDAAAARRLRGGETIRLSAEGEEIELQPADVLVVEEPVGGLAVQASDGYLVALDRTLDEELLAEGMARELVNRVQRLRRDAGLAVSDRVSLGIAGDGEVERAARRYREYIAGETLAVRLELASSRVGRLDHTCEVEVGGHRARLGLSRVTADAG